MTPRQLRAQRARRHHRQRSEPGRLENFVSSQTRRKLLEADLPPADPARWLAGLGIER